MLKPTNRLRWVERKIHEKDGDCTTEKVLQQLWQRQPTLEADICLDQDEHMEANGVWFDISVETE